VPNLVIEDVAGDFSIWNGETGLLTVTVRNEGTGPAYSVFYPSVKFALDIFLDPDTPPASYPMEAVGECFTFVDPIPAGLAEAVVISITIDPILTCRPGSLQTPWFGQVWFKVDNWPRDELFPGDNGHIPESNERDNVFGPVTVASFAASNIYLPVVIRSP
jgi:hypothetical protein